MSSITRRSLLAGIGAAGAATALAGCGGDSGSSGSGNATLRFTWWGNDTRTDLTQQVIDLFQQQHPDITIQAENGAWSNYWDKLSTQFAANDAPDIIQMDEKYVSEYAGNGMLLDLNSAGVTHDQFASGTVDSGEYEGTLVALNAGINAVVLMANQKLLSDAGVDVPDDTNWTWDSMRQLASQITDALLSGSYGSQNPVTVEAAFRLFLRQLGKDAYDANGLAFDVSDATRFFQMGLDFQGDSASPTNAETSEDTGKTIDQAMVSTNQLAFASYWSNQVNSITKAAGNSFSLLRPPTLAGSLSESGLWYKASMYWSASARTRYPEACATFINFLANDVEAGKILGTERGVPANTQVQEALTDQLSDVDKQVVDYIDLIGDDLGSTAVVAPRGLGTMGTVLVRYAQDVLFNRQSPDQAAQAFIDECQGMLN